MLAGQPINVTTNAEKAARVMLRWRDGGQTARENFDGGYAMRLEFGALAGNRMPGKIYLCLPDETKSYVAGTFNVEIRSRGRRGRKAPSSNLQFQNSRREALFGIWA